MASVAPSSIALGIDTGGTYTDAVLFDDARGVLGKAKALTTRHDLTIGIANAVDSVLAGASVTPADIALVALSTTLATNALVEGRGGRVALVFIGFPAGHETRGGLTAAMQGDPVVCIRGGHDSHGDPLAPLDIDTLRARVTTLASSVSGFAVTSQFATRNPAHEVAAREVIVAATALPVTCGHELSAQLNGPKRAVTSVLNARLIGMITGLIDAAREIVDRHGITAPMMVVRGDGALMRASMAIERPIETILSGPAASVVGAAYLTGVDNAIVADIGGTTTDVAVVEGGVPHLDPAGAVVGGHHTMVEAVAMTTVGLGGDSEVTVVDNVVTPAVELGPRRVVPLCLLAAEHPSIVHAVLDRQLLSDVANAYDARFVVPGREHRASTDGLGAAELALLDRIGDQPLAVGAIVRGHADGVRLDRLVRRGLAALAGFTPTDASHVVGQYGAFDADASMKAATLLTRKRSVAGRPVAVDAVQFAHRVIATLTRRSAELLLDVALGNEGLDVRADDTALAAALDRRRGIVEIGARITVPVVALGAPAPIYYPAIVDLVHAASIIPDDADVANAIGAVVGRVRMRADMHISHPSRGRFRVHASDGIIDESSLDAAIATAERLAAAAADAAAFAAGADSTEVTIHRVLNTVGVDGADAAELFVDGTVTAFASGRPRLRH